jgi:DNA-binding SARP family transcriptional activator
MGVQRLLAYLALNERPSLRLCVAGVLWLDVSEERSRANLRSALWRLRRIDPTLVDVTTSHISLARSVTVDVRTSVAAARRILGRSEDTMIDSDAAILTGELLPDWYDDWVVFERERLRELRLHALEALAARWVDEGRYAEAVEAALAAVHAEPLRETAQRVLLRAYIAEGNRARAILHYANYRVLLAHDLGIEPARETAALVGANAP